MQDNIRITTGEAIIKKVSEGKLLGVIMDKNLNFKSHFPKLVQNSQSKTACPCWGVSLHGSQFTISPNEQFYEILVKAAVH